MLKHPSKIFCFSTLLILIMYVHALAKGTCPLIPNGARIVKIGILTDGSTPEDKHLVKIFKKSLIDAFPEEYKPKFSQKWTMSSKESLKGAKSALKRLLSSRYPDIILAIGILSAEAAYETRNLNKPVIAPYIPSSMAQNGLKAKKNFVYIDRALYLERDIQSFKKVSKFKHLGIVLDKRDVIDDRVSEKYLDSLKKRLDIELSLIPAGTYDQLTQSIPKTVDAVAVGPLWHFNEIELKKLAQFFIKKRLPAFALWDERQVELGLLAGLEPKDKDVSLSRRTAIAIIDILKGARPEKMKIDFVRTRDLTINMATARGLNIYPSLLVLTGANLINTEVKEIKRKLNIKKAVEEAISSNLRLLSAKVTVKAGEHKVREEMAGLLPRVDIETGLSAIDQDRAKMTAGASPERAWTGSAGGSVLLYSEEKWAKYRAQQYLQQARKYRQQRVRLDVTYDAAVAYLNILRARTIERIYKENLALTKANLERAQIKVATGAAGPDEVYRWESKFANDRRQVLYKESDTMNAMEALNRILHRPLDETFLPEEASLKDPLFIAGDRFYFELMENPLYLRKFKRFAAREAMKFRPELHVFDSAIKAKERLKVAAKREIWLPTFTVDWNVEHYFAQDGSGRRDHAPLDDTDWTIGVFARIPLFEGGRQVAKANRLEEELSRLKIDKNSLIEAITQNVLSAINKTRASYPSISLTREAQEAAKKNLDLVTDAYIHGIKNIIDLLDAQNQYLNARLDAANAVYNFLIDFMGVQRAMGEFFIFMPDDMRFEWLQRAKKEINLR